MKKNIFLALAAAVVLLFSACTKDLDLTGTKWQANYNGTRSVTLYGFPVTVTVDMNVLAAFTDAKNYTMDITGTASNSTTGLSFNLEDVLGDEAHSHGTYTFDGESGVLYQSDGTSQPFTYNKKENTITATAQDISFTFTQVQ